MLRFFFKASMILLRSWFQHLNSSGVACISCILAPIPLSIHVAFLSIFKLFISAPGFHPSSSSPAPAQYELSVYNPHYQHDPLTPSYSTSNPRRNIEKTHMLSTTSPTTSFKLIFLSFGLVYHGCGLFLPLSFLEIPTPLGPKICQTRWWSRIWRRLMMMGSLQTEYQQKHLGTLA